MKRVVIIFIFIFTIPQISGACGTHGVHTQTEVDNLKCIAITNSITIEPNSSSQGDPIYNLDTLFTIISLGTDLIIRNNPELTDITGLRNLQSIGQNLIIENNLKLNMCCALNGLINNGTIGRSILIQNNGGGDCANHGNNINACLIVPALSFWALAILILLTGILGCVVLTVDIGHLKLSPSKLFLLM